MSANDSGLATRAGAAADAASARAPGTFTVLFGDLAPGRLHLLTGGAGSGKSAVALQFIADGLARAETCAMLAAAHGRDVRSLAAVLGIRVDDALRSRRLHLLRWRSAAHRDLAHVTAVERVVDDLRQLLRGTHATRIVIDSFAPFVGEAFGAELLAEALESLGATTLLTLASRIDDGYDRWLEPLVQRVAGIIHLRRRGTTMELECVSRRGAPLLRERGRFAIDPGRGLTGVQPQPRRRDRVTDRATDPAAILLLGDGSSTAALVKEAEA